MAQVLALSGVRLAIFWLKKLNFQDFSQLFWSSLVMIYALLLAQIRQFLHLFSARKNDKRPRQRKFRSNFDPRRGPVSGSKKTFLDFLEIVLEFFNNLFWHFFAIVPTFGFISSSKSLQMDSKILNLCQTLALEEGNFRPFQGYKSPFQDTFKVKSVWESSG